MDYHARLYDPQIGRFVSADSIVQSPGDLQSFNRYTYCANNPLIYTDPSGHDFGIVSGIIVGAIIGAVVGGAVAAIQGGDILMGVVTGAISGACFGAVGGLIEAYAISSTMAQVSMHVTAGAVSGGANAAITGGDIGMGALTGAISGGIGKFAGGFLDKYNFGTQLVGRSLIGGDFWDGFGQGAWTAGFGFLCNDMHLKFLKWANSLFNSTTRAGNQATDVANKTRRLHMEIGGDKDDGPVNAWKHCEWSRVIKDEQGWFMAYALTTAHELFNNGGPFGSQGLNGFRMDTYNNGMGIFFTQRQSCDTLMNNGQLMTTVPKHNPSGQHLYFFGD